MVCYQVIPPHRRGEQSRLLRLKKDMASAWHAQEGICALCGHRMPYPLDHTGPKEWRASCEHVIPLTMGGSDHLGNIVASHRCCNSWKSSHPPTGCELIWLQAVNARLGVEPVRW